MKKIYLCLLFVVFLLFAACTKTAHNVDVADTAPEGISSDSAANTNAPSEGLLQDGYSIVSLEKAQGKHTIRHYFVLNNVIAAGYYDGTEIENIRRAGVVIFDTSGKLIKDVTIGEFDKEIYFYLKDNKVCTNVPLTYLNGIQDTEDRYQVDIDGNVTKLANVKSRDESLTSPSGSKKAYSSKNSLYITDKKGTRLAKQGYYGGEMLGQSFSPYEWISENKLVYQFEGYSSGEGCGVFDTHTNKTIFDCYTGRPIGVKDGKLYSLNDQEAPFNIYSVNINNPDEEPKPLLKIDNGAAYIEVDACIQFDKAVCIYMLDQENKLTVYSLKDGTLLRERSLSQKYNKVLLLSEKLVALFHDNQMVLVDIN